MRFSLTSLIRLGLLSSLATTVVALGLSHVAQPHESLRNASAVRYVSLNPSLYCPENRRSNWLDPSTGRVAKLELPTEEEIDFASLSPWLDETGRPQVVGRWCAKEGVGNGMTKAEFGLMRVRFPSGEVVQKIQSEVLPISAPCWFPAPETRILFGAGDGKLYQLALDAREAVVAPVEIRWAIPKPGEGEVFLADPAWIDEEGDAPRRLVATIRVVEKGRNGRQSFSNTRLWWLQLGADCESIVAAAPLVPADPAAADRDVRNPVTQRFPDGRTRLAYLRNGRKAGWEVVVTDLDAADAPGGPLVARRPGRVVLDTCLPMTPAFSSDGRTVSSLKGEVFRSKEIVRASLEPERGGLAAAGGDLVANPAQ